MSTFDFAFGQFGVAADPGPRMIDNDATSRYLEEIEAQVTVLTDDHDQYGVIDVTLCTERCKGLETTSTDSEYGLRPTRFGVIGRQRRDAFHGRATAGHPTEQST